MTSDLVRRLIAANKGNKKAAGGDVFYLAAERLDYLEYENFKIKRLLGLAYTVLAKLHESGVQLKELDDLLREVFLKRS